MIKLLKSILFSPIYFIIDLLDYARSVYMFYPNKVFREADLRILFSYLILNPYAICKRYLKDFPEDQVQKVYGETFFSTLELIAKKIVLTKEDTIYDLGCGRGRTVFWFNAIYGCRAIGVEINPLFIHKARKISEKMALEGVEFKLANLMDLDYSNATHIYLYGSVFTEEAIAHIIENFKHLKPGTVVISVTFPLSDYTEENLFTLEQEFTARFLWGYTGIYVQRKI